MSNYKRKIDEMIGEEARFTEELADRIISQSKKQNPRPTRRIMTGLAAAMVLIGVSGVTINMLNDFSPDPQTNTQSVQTEDIITDPDTAEDVSLATPSETSMLIEWGSDGMDRGDHHYMTFIHDRLLVVETSGYQLTRGTVVYFKTPETILAQNDMAEPDQIARVVGLPGETVEIKNGKVYIDDKRLDTFYGEAHSTGMTHEELLAIDRPDNTNDYSTDYWYDFFSEDMPPVTVDEDSIFLLVDNWGRGYDSRDFGLLEHGDVTGVVMGYEE